MLFKRCSAGSASRTVFCGVSVWGCLEKLLVRGPVARETARRFIIWKSRQIGDSESEFLQKGKNSGEMGKQIDWETLWSEKSSPRRALCSGERGSDNLSLSLPPSLSISPRLSLSWEVVNPNLSLSSHKSGVQAELPDRTNKNIYIKKKIVVYLNPQLNLATLSPRGWPAPTFRAAPRMCAGVSVCACARTHARAWNMRECVTEQFMKSAL